MEPTPAAPAKNNPIPMMLAVIAAAILSLSCCGLSIPVFLGFFNFGGNLSGAEFSGNVPPMYGFFCIGAGIIPWVIPVIVAIARRQKK